MNQPAAQASLDGQWEAALRGAGFRVTPQRRAVLQALSEMSHATGEQLLERVHQQHPELNLSTIYRTLDVLGSVGLVTHAHFHHGVVTYHAVGGPAHVHLVCRGCGEVSSAPRTVAEPMARELVAHIGFLADLTHLVLHGLCRDCSGSGTFAADTVLDQP